MNEEELKFIIDHKTDDADDLLLHSSRYPGIDVRRVVVQLKGIRIAENKLPLWASTDGVLYPEHLPMEQCSSEQTSRYKLYVVRQLFSKDNTNPDDSGNFGKPLKIADLTGGFGVDAVMLSRGFPNCQLTYIERNPDLCALARHNFPLFGVDSSNIICGDCENALNDLPEQDIIFIDPSRRDSYGRKTVALSDCQPDITILNSQLLAKSTMVLVKLSPMLDISSAINDLKGLSEIHVVSVEGECKEVLLLLSRYKEKSDDDISVFCINIQKGNTYMEQFSMGEVRSAVVSFTNRLSRYLYEPNASVMKSNAMNAVGKKYGIMKLHPNSHLFTSDSLIGEFPGRIFEIMGIYGFNKRDHKLLASLDKANITVRNFPLSVSGIRKRLKLKEGGGDYLFATTLYDNSHVLIYCRKC